MAEAIMNGKIEEVPVDSLIQIISPANKTGLLELSSSNKVSKLYFEEGDIVFVESTGYSKVNFLVNYLTYIKRMNSNNIQEIRSFGEKYGYTFEQSLFTGKYLDKDEINYIIKSYFEDLICDIFTTKNGDYKFSPLNSVLKVGTIKLDSQYLLMEAGRRIDVKPSIFEMFSNRSLVFSIVDKKILIKKIFKNDDFGPSELVGNEHIDKTGFADSNLDTNNFTLKSNNKSTIEDSVKRNIINQINGIDNVDEIIQFSGWSEFRTLEFLKELYSDNLIECIGEKESSVKLQANVTYSTTEKVSFFSYALIMVIISFVLLIIKLFNMNLPFLNIISIDYDKINYNKLVIESIENFYIEKVDYASKIFYINTRNDKFTKKDLYNNNYINNKEYTNSKD